LYADTLQARLKREFEDNEFNGIKNIFVPTKGDTYLLRSCIWNTTIFWDKGKAYDTCMHFIYEKETDIFHTLT
jgi:hypothetical protein